jgi:AraC family transcriptional regulator of arabinose operon
MPPKNISAFDFAEPCTANRTTMAAGGQAIYRPDGLPAWTLNRTCAGTGFFDLGDNAFSTRQGDLVLIAPKVFNHYGPAPGPGGWQHHWAVFREDAQWLVEVPWPSVGPGIRCLRKGDDATDQAVAAQFQLLIELVCGLAPHRRQAGLAMIRSMFILVEGWCSGNAANGIDARIQRGCAAVHQRLHEPVEVADMAAAAGLSLSRFAHLFTQELGISPRAWIERRRMRMAADLLRMSNRSISSIAAQVGYLDPAYFRRVFRQHTGVPPSSWRDGNEAAQ